MLFGYIPYFTSVHRLVVGVRLHACIVYYDGKYGVRVLRVPSGLEEPNRTSPVVTVNDRPTHPRNTWG